MTRGRSSRMEPHQVRPSTRCATTSNCSAQEPARSFRKARDPRPTPLTRRMNKSLSESKDQPHPGVDVHAFTYNALPSRVLFGVNQLDRLSDEMTRLGGQRALVVCTARRRAEGEAIVSRLGRAGVGLFAGALTHVPIEVAREARTYARHVGADCIIAIGGGSTIGLGKAIALESESSVLAIPTTYSGSEMTPIYGITEMG